MDSQEADYYEVGKDSYRSDGPASDSRKGLGSQIHLCLRLRLARLGRQREFGKGYRGSGQLHWRTRYLRIRAL